MDKYEKLAKDTRKVLSAINKAFNGGFGRFENDGDIFYVTYVDWELYLFKADQRCGSGKLYQDGNFRNFFSVCLGFMEEGDV